MCLLGAAIGFQSDALSHFALKQQMVSFVPGQQLDCCTPHQKAKLKNLADRDELAYMLSMIAEDYHGGALQLFSLGSPQLIQVATMICLSLS